MPVSSMEMATDASRGSPLVEKSPNPIHGRTEMMQMMMTIVTGFCR